jgi:hypothetical protein
MDYVAASSHPAAPEHGGARRSGRLAQFYDGQMCATFDALHNELEPLAHAPPKRRRGVTARQRITRRGSSRGRLAAGTTASSTSCGVAPPSAV